MHLTVQKWQISQVVFEGIIGSSYLGDTAIDDITVADGACPDTRNTR